MYHTKRDLAVIIGIFTFGVICGIVMRDGFSSPSSEAPPATIGGGGLLPTDTLELQVFLNSKDYKGKDGYRLAEDGRMGVNTIFAKDRYICDMHAVEAMKRAKGGE